MSECICTLYSFRFFFRFSLQWGKKEKSSKPFCAGCSNLSQAVSLVKIIFYNFQKQILYLPTFFKSNVWDFRLHISRISQEFPRSSDDHRRFSDGFRRCPKISGGLQIFPKIFRGLPNQAVTRVFVENSYTSDRVGLTRSFAEEFFGKIGNWIFI